MFIACLFNIWKCYPNRYNTYINNTSKQNIEDVSITIKQIHAYDFELLLSGESRDPPAEVLSILYDLLTSM